MRLPKFFATFKSENESELDEFTVGGLTLDNVIQIGKYLREKDEKERIENLRFFNQVLDFVIESTGLTEDEIGKMDFTRTIELFNYHIERQGL
ncbi:hypothetical protein ACQCT5_04640 [Sutcliffiella halmapala]